MVCRLKIQSEKVFNNPINLGIYVNFVLQDLMFRFHFLKNNDFSDEGFQTERSGWTCALGKADRY